jgi:vacuolar-type H+-ATPase subunit H
MSTTPHSGSDREIQQELERAKSEASELASSAADAAKRRGQDYADRVKDSAAEQADELASAIESTADDLETSDGGEMIAGYGRSLAELMRRFAGGLRERTRSRTQSDSLRRDGVEATVGQRFDVGAPVVR